MTDKDYPETPELRAVEIFPQKIEGQPSLCLKDPLGFSPGVMVVSRQAGILLSRFNGRNSLDEIIRELKQTPLEISREELTAFVRQLNEHLFLNSRRFQEERKNIINEYLNSDVREPSNAGEAYPEDPDKCRAYLSDLLNDEEEREQPEMEHITSFIAPHIDLERGYRTYSKTYAPLEQQFEDELFVVLGTSHAPMEHLVCPSKKDYVTPVGTIPTDRELARTLLDELPGNRRRDRFRHKNEHSIEFQALFLSHLSGTDPDRASLLPVLCAPFSDPETGRIRSPEQLEKQQREIEVLDRILSRVDRDIIYVCGADLAHVGQRFGDQKPLNDSHLEWVEREDRTSLTHCESLDPDKFLKHVRKNNDRRRICGLPPIYLMLQLMDADRGELVEYRQAVNKKQETAVSFAGMYFFGAEGRK